MICGENKEDALKVNAMLSGKTLKSFSIIESGRDEGAFCLVFESGEILTIHGGSVGYENANPWFKFFISELDQLQTLL